MVNFLPCVWWGVAPCMWWAVAPCCGGLYRYAVVGFSAMFVVGCSSAMVAVGHNAMFVVGCSAVVMSQLNNIPRQRHHIMATTSGVHYHQCSVTIITLWLASKPITFLFPRAFNKSSLVKVNRYLVFQ